MAGDGKLANSGNKNGFDTISGSGLLTGTDGNDLIWATGPANINGAGGNDVIYGSQHTASTTGGVDSILGGSGNDWINGAGGTDGAGHSDTLDGGSGRDWVSFQTFTYPQSTITGGAAYAGGVKVNIDTVSHGSMGANTYSYTDPNALGVGSGGTVIGKVFNFENVWGSAGNDTIFGSSANNDLHGGAGADSINGFGGNDEIQGGAGNDMLTGGTGTDTFVFENTLAANGVDTITDFGTGTVAGSADILDLTAALANKGITQGNIANYVAVATGNLNVDLDGVGGNPSATWAHLDGVGAAATVQVEISGVVYTVTST